MKHILISAACLLCLPASADISKVVVHPPSLIAACPSARSTFVAHPSYQEVSATASSETLTLTFKGILKVCDLADGEYQWNIVNPFDYYVSYISAEGKWQKRREVINTDLNPNNRIAVTASVLAQKLSGVGNFSANKNGFKGSVNFKLDELLTDADRGALDDGTEVTKVFETNIAINSTTYLSGKFVEYAQAGDVLYARVNVDVTFKKGGRGPRVSRVSVY